MSSPVLQRVAVRMLFDPTWTDTVYANPELALQGLELTQSERNWLVEPDIRRWKADPHRSHRGLQAVLEEYCVSAGVVLGYSSLSDLHDFYTSSEFHDAVMAQHSMCLAFGNWLMSRFPEIRFLTDIELEIARVRRRRTESVNSPTGSWVLAENVGVIQSMDGGLELYGQLSRTIAEHPAGPLDFLIRGHALQLESYSLGKESVSIVIEAVGIHGEIQLSSSDSSLGMLLDYLRYPKCEQNLITFAESVGAKPSEIREILAFLSADGLIRQIF